MNRKTIKAYDKNKNNFKNSILWIFILGIAIFAFHFSEQYMDNQKVENIVAYTVQTVQNEEDDTQLEKDYNIKDYFTWESLILVFKEFCIIIISIIISSILTMAIIEKKDKNEIYSNAVWDFLDETNWKLDLSDLEKTNINITKEISQKNIPSGLVEYVLSKICYCEEKFYYTNFEINVSCKIEKGCIHKNIIEKISLRSYDENYKFDAKENPFILAKIACEKPNKNDRTIKCNLSVSEVSIKNEATVPKVETTDIDKRDIKYKHINTINRSASKLGYTKTHIAFCPVDVELNNKTDTQINVIYNTKVPINDKTFVVRLPCACKNFKSTFTLDGNNTNLYKLSGEAFGFLDNGINTINQEDKKKYLFEFNNWSFKNDGFVINILNNFRKEINV